MGDLDVKDFAAVLRQSFEQLNRERSDSIQKTRRDLSTVNVNVVVRQL